mmetsp:Transcript_38859/g.76399  ORF Transcript_38859/g.76399 Transcript_38859/m.76399 type:complete len:253 (+) Transcript_38859:437-1195(+)
MLTCCCCCCCGRSSRGCRCPSSGRPSLEALLYLPLAHEVGVASLGHEAIAQLCESIECLLVFFGHLLSLLLLLVLFLLLPDLEHRLLRPSLLQPSQSHHRCLIVSRQNSTQLREKCRHVNLHDLLLRLCLLLQLLDLRTLVVVLELGITRLLIDRVQPGVSHPLLWFLLRDIISEFIKVACGHLLSHVEGLNRLSSLVLLLFRVCLLCRPRVLVDARSLLLFLVHHVGCPLSPLTHLAGIGIVNVEVTQVRI